MRNTVLSWARNILRFFHLDLTLNLAYDRATYKILKSRLKKGDLCVDVGCHKGEILDLFIKFAGHGHFAFEPIPDFFENLKRKYGPENKIFPFALSDFNGESSFQLVENAPAYSGIRKRNYGKLIPKITEIKVQVSTLDQIIPFNIKISVIKIDVEGGEMQVLLGGQRTILNSKPLIIFEFGLGASDFYGTNPKILFSFFKNELNYKLYPLRQFNKSTKELNEEEFLRIYSENLEYYFVGKASN